MFNQLFKYYTSKSKILKQINTDHREALLMDLRFKSKKAKSQLESDHAEAIYINNQMTSKQQFDDLKSEMKALNFKVGTRLYDAHLNIKYRIRNTGYLFFGNASPQMDLEYPIKSGELQTVRITGREAVIAYLSLTIK